MTRIVHLSDLHYGRVRKGLAEALLESVAAQAPDLVVVSGDLTQRARTWQFRAARAFLERLPAPWLAVPGNHDIPLENLAERIVTPFARYRRHIAHELEPIYGDATVCVAGVNSVNPFVHEAGRFRKATAARLCRVFEAAGPDRLRVVVLHHPITHGPQVTKTLMRGAGHALSELSDCGADVVLCGHLHAWAAAPSAAREGGRELLMVQAGTSLSTRLRGEENDYNLLVVDGPTLTVERHASGDALAFRPTGTHSFRREGAAWRAQPQSSTTLPEPPDRMAAKPSTKSLTFSR